MYFGSKNVILLLVTPRSHNEKIKEFTEKKRSKSQKELECFLDRKINIIK